MAGKIILHVDGDGFFASCEMAAYPHLRGKPVVVGAERGIVTAASYPAKRMGVTRGLPIFKLKREFPNVTILPSHFELYEAYSQKLFGVLSRFSDNVERYSIDECFAEFTLEHGEDPETKLRIIKSAVQDDLGITFSFGLAQTKSLAKLASKWQKPDGCTYIAPGTERSYLEGTPIGKIWGIGWATAQVCKQKGIKTALDLRQMTEIDIEHSFSRSIAEIWQELSGRQIYRVHNDSQIQKSLQATRTFPKKRGERDSVLSELSYNIEVACARARDAGLFAQRGHFFLKTNEFRYHGMEFILPEYTADPKEILSVVSDLFPLVYKSEVYYRATGITLSALLPENKMKRDLFGIRESHIEDEAKLTSVYDDIRERFGNHALVLGSSLAAVSRREDMDEALDLYVYGLPYPYLGEVV